MNKSTQFSTMCNCYYSDPNLLAADSSIHFAIPCPTGVGTNLNSYTRSQTLDNLVNHRKKQVYSIFFTNVFQIEFDEKISPFIAIAFLSFLIKAFIETWIMYAFVIFPYLCMAIHKIT